MTGTGENSARNCIAALQKRLTHRSANVQLFSLTVSKSECDT
jgi:signal transducing adaptor molecule